MKNIKSQETLHCGACAEDGGNNHGKKVNQNVFIGSDTAQHILKRIFLLSPFLLYVLQLHVVLPDFEYHGHHKDKENQRTGDSDSLERNTYAFTHQSSHDNGIANSGHNRDNTLYSQDAVPFRGIVSESRDHGLHGHLGERAGKVKQQICNQEPYNLHKI